MKKIVLTVVLLFVFFIGKAHENKLIMPGDIEKHMANDVKLGKTAESSITTTEKIEYKVTLNEIVNKEEFERVKLRLKQDNAPFEIIDVDFQAKTVHIKLQNKIPYDQIEKVFGSVRLNVVKIEGVL